MVKQHLNKEKVNMLFVIVNNFRWKSKNDKVKEKKFKRKILKVNEEILYFMMKSFFCLIQLVENWAGHHKVNTKTDERSSLLTLRAVESDMLLSKSKMAITIC